MDVYTQIRNLEVLLLFIVVDDVVNTDWLFSSKVFGIETNLNNVKT